MGMNHLKILVPKLSAFEFEKAIEKLKRHKSPGVDQIPAELIKEGGRTIRWEIHKLFGVWSRRNFLRSEGLDHCTYLSIYCKIDIKILL
jgi:hypothetical protein